MKIRVLIIEDHPMFRQAVVLALSTNNNIEIVGEAIDGKTGVNMAMSLKPDVILMDIGLPEIDGVQATDLIKKSDLETKILIFTSRESSDDVFAALAAGADGYITKGANETQLLQAITAVNEGTAWLDPAIARLVLSNVQQQNSQSTNKNLCSSVSDDKLVSTQNSFGLTDRELEVLALIVEGLNNPEIADRLIITKSTVKTHVHSILQKLYVSNRTQASMTAIKEGLV